MSRYLEEAADLLRKASKTNEDVNAKMRSHLMEGRERIAKQFAVLAAIDKGLLPAEVTESVLDAIRDGDA